MVGKIIAWYVGGYGEDEEGDKEDRGEEGEEKSGPHGSRIGLALYLRAKDTSRFKLTGPAVLGVMSYKLFTSVL